jgi:hypothetical protein
MTDLHTITKEPVRARAVVGCVYDAVIDLVAAVHRAIDPIAQRRCHAQLAAAVHIADLRTIAKKTVGTGCVIGRMDDAIIVLVTRIHRARDIIVHHGRHPRRAATVIGVLIEGVADLYPITKSLVGAHLVRGCVHDQIALLVAGVGGADDAVIDGRRRSWLAVVVRVTDLGAITEEPVGTGLVRRQMQDLVVDFAAGIDGAAHPIVHRPRFTRGAIIDGVADLVAIAEEPIGAHLVVWRVLDEVELFIARIQRAPDPVAEHRRLALLATLSGVTDLGAITKSPVGAPQVDGCVHHHRQLLAAGVAGARHVVVQQG